MGPAMHVRLRLIVKVELLELARQDFLLLCKSVDILGGQ